MCVLVTLLKEDTGHVINAITNPVIILLKANIRYHVYDNTIPVTVLF